MALAYVLDTNVVIAAVGSDQGASRQFLLGALKGRFEILLSVALMLEYEAVLTRPEHLAASGLNSRDVGHILDDLAAVGRLVRLAFRWRPTLQDAADHMVLETAVNGGAGAIVTFNQRDFLRGVQGFACRLITPAAALQELRRTSL